jgi:hypothetical protein
MAAIYSLPVLTDVLNRPGALDHYHLFDSVPELVEACRAPAVRAKARGVQGRDSFIGGLTWDQALRMAVEGDAAAVAASDALLSQLEDAGDIYATRRRTIDDVVGGVPNVPAFLAGHPASMRRRVREQHEAAPLSVVVDLTSSAGISAADVQRRGIAVLALVRALTARRPVELWVGCSIDADAMRGAFHMYARVETTPLDLLRAAHWISHPSMSRGLIYATGRALYGYRGSWPYGRGPLTAEHGRLVLSRALPHATDVLYVPAIHASDALVSQPLAWVRQQLAKHAGDAPDAQIEDAA